MQRTKYSYIAEQSQKVAPVLCVNTTPKDAYLRFIKTWYVVVVIGRKINKT